MPREQSAERAGASGDEDGALRVERSGDCEDDLADGFGLGERAEGSRRMADVVDGDRGGAKDALLEEGGELGEELLDAVGMLEGEVEESIEDAGMLFGDGALVAESVWPISMKRPPRGKRRREASMKSPARQLRTTSTPSPWVERRKWGSKSSVREEAM